MLLHRGGPRGRSAAADADAGHGRAGKTVWRVRGAAWPFAALCRLLFIAGHTNLSLGHFPSRLLTSAPLRTQSFGPEEALAQEVENYLAGDSTGLVESLMGVCVGVEMRTPFEQNLMLADLVTVEEFFARGPAKVRRLRQQSDGAADWVEPEALVDFLAANRLEVAALNDRIAP